MAGIFIRTCSLVCFEIQNSDMLISTEFRYADLSASLTGTDNLHDLEASTLGDWKVHLTHPHVDMSSDFHAEKHHIKVKDLVFILQDAYHGISSGNLIMVDVNL